MRTHCPFSCFIISNFPQKGQLQGKETEKQFIIVEDVKVTELFGNSEIDIIDDTKRYIINDNAFENADAYMKIYSI